MKVIRGKNYIIVPNFTTSGLGLTDELAGFCKKYCGAVAVSWYRNEYTTKAIQCLTDSGIVVTNERLTPCLNMLMFLMEK